MKLSARSRYGTRMMVDLANHYEEGPVQIRSIAERQDISAKYLEQLIIPLKKCDYIESVRGPKGGHMLKKSPGEISVGEIVRVLEEEASLVHCVEKPESCKESNVCPTRDIWETATKAMYDQLDVITLSDVIEQNKKI
jgi:Rrf2 family protein